MSSDFFGISSGGNQSYSDMLVESYKKTQASRVDTLKDRKTDLQSRQSFYNTLNSRLNSLVAQLDKFGDYKIDDGSYSFNKLNDIDSKFQTRVSTLSEKDFFSVSTKGEAVVGTNTLQVHRLATNDVLVSQRLNLADAFTEAAGEKEFSISVGGEAVAVKVNFTGDETNEQAMYKIVAAINSTSDIKVSATMVKDTETSGRISLVAKESGESNRISFTENTTTALLGWTDSMYADQNARIAMSGTDAGYKLANASVLNSLFEVNGIEISRNKNQVDDVLQNMSITLQKVQPADSQPITITTDIDPQGVESLVDALVKDFNGLLYFLSNNRSVQKTDPGMSTLQTRLRSIPSSQLSFSDNPDAPKYITDIGFKINNDGTIVLQNKERLKEYLLKDNGAQNVAELFTSATGFASKVNEVIVNLKPAESGQIGLIRSRNESINSQITSIDRRIATVESSIEQQAQTMRKEYENYLKVYLQAQNQFSLLSSMPTSGGGGYNSLLSSQYSQS